MAPSKREASSEKLVEDPLFGQRYRFSRHGDVLRIEAWVDPGGGVLVEHVHPRIEERFEVLAGEVTFRMAGEKLRRGAGDVVVAAAGQRHAFENTGVEVAHLISEAEPALDLQDSIEEAIAMAGRLTARGIPKGPVALLEAVEFADRYRRTTVPAFPPQPIQRFFFPALARLERSRRKRIGSR